MAKYFLEVIGLRTAVTFDIFGTKRMAARAPDGAIIRHKDGSPKEVYKTDPSAHCTLVIQGEDFNDCRSRIPEGVFWKVREVIGYQTDKNADGQKFETSPGIDLGLALNYNEYDQWRIREEDPRAHFVWA